ncbi:hypothetical protein GCM10009638_00250 [Luteococcus sanguinis]
MMGSVPACWASFATTAWARPGRVRSELPDALAAGCTVDGLALLLGDWATPLAVHEDVSNTTAPHRPATNRTALELGFVLTR